MTTGVAAAGGQPVVRSRPEMIELTSLDPNPFQPRLRSFDDDEGLDALVQDIRHNGFRGVLEVRKNPDDPLMGRPQAVWGHRRIEAAKRAGLTRILVQWVNFDDQQMKQSAIRENLLREDLTPWEEAVFVQGLRNDGMTYDEIKEFVGKSKSWVQSRVRLLTLEGPLREAAMTNPEMFTVLSTLIYLPEEVRVPLLERAKAGEIGVEDLRAMVRAQRQNLVMLENSLMPDGGRRIDITLEQQRVAAAKAETADPRPAAAEPVAPERDAVWDNLRAKAAEAPWTPPPLPIRRENPMDNPEGARIGLAIDNGIGSGEDLLADLAAHPTDDGIARDLARQILVGPSGIVDPTMPPPPTPIRKMVDNSDVHWRNPSLAMSSEELRMDRNTEFARILSSIKSNLRKRVEETDPALMPDDLRQQIRQDREEIQQLLVIF